MELWRWMSIKCLLHKNKDLSLNPNTLIKRKKNCTWWCTFTIPTLGLEGRDRQILELTISQPNQINELPVQ